MATREARLASSIAAAVSGDVSMHMIVQDVIGPILQEAIVLSEAAHDAVTRAIDVVQSASLAGQSLATRILSPSIEID